jgi:hypothetical protein
MNFKYHKSEEFVDQLSKYVRSLQGTSCTMQSVSYIMICVVLHMDRRKT